MWKGQGSPNVGHYSTPTGQQEAASQTPTPGFVSYLMNKASLFTRVRKHLEKLTSVCMCPSIVPLPLRFQINKQTKNRKPM